MREAYVTLPSYALGEHTHTVEESVSAGRTVTDVAGLRGAGFERHCIAGSQTTAFDLARAAVEPIVKELGALDAIIYATCLPQNGNVGPESLYRESRDVKYLMDYPASRLQAYLQQDAAQVIGINQQACTSMLGSLRIARALVAAEPATQRILCITSDRFPEGAIYEQAYNLISDGAAAVVVTTEPRGFRIVGTGQITNGAMVIASDDETVGNYFSYTHRVITETLASSGLRADQIDWVVPQNTAITAWKVLSRMFKIGMDRVWCPTLPSCGHIISGDNVVNLKSLIDSGNVKPGERLLLLMAGYGMNWQCTILEAV
ncbi:MAG TPA: 3-oxoacyl-[acyl-carrier-protein] synthase III C-terminal domain-containing protein [Polyangiaceae bacterium]|nr:3-oxoacyl-[acyl-carrier-protein] synthase III C-terminal domain-containing protein [Polyangiaceae bacterium]